VAERTGYFEHGADIGVIGRGATPEAAFEGAAEAAFAIMTDLAQVTPVQTLRLEFEEDDLELALVTWLNQLLGRAREAGLALGRFRLSRSARHWTGEADGEPWREALARGTEVKGATLTMLRVERTPAGWEARCVVDV
jgi:SHS2 domain-containing protein